MYTDFLKQQQQTKIFHFFHSAQFIRFITYTWLNIYWQCGTRPVCTNFGTKYTYLFHFMKQGNGFMMRKNGGELCDWTGVFKRNLKWGATIVAIGWPICEWAVVVWHTNLSNMYCTILNAGPISYRKYEKCA